MKKRLLQFQTVILFILVMGSCRQEDSALTSSNKIETKLTRNTLYDKRAKEIFEKVIFNPEAYGFKLDSTKNNKLYYSKLNILIPLNKEFLTIPIKSLKIANTNQRLSIGNHGYGKDTFILNSEEHIGWFGESYSGATSERIVNYDDRNLAIIDKQDITIYARSGDLFNYKSPNGHYIIGEDLYLTPDDTDSGKEINTDLYHYANETPNGDLLILK
ncbi:hypothetical protein [Elizabethkingia anophelis]|nr:hypothetical protein [Elizabethkingia anophelis]MCT4296280.1 hypothetical protein [Elizabethkingia anophelis]MCT4299228.1 hypothetical protein [Elizabethkingia anophelis]MYY49342.1 hypothetical protein [Elizabethkingia anophelis]